MRRAVVAALAVTIGVLSVAAVPDLPFTTYAGRSELLSALDSAAGLGLIAAGLATRGRLGTVAMLAGAAWFAPDWVGWQGAPPLVRSVAAVAALFAAPLLLHLALGSARRVVLALYGVAALAALALALVRDPFLDQYCWSDCGANAFLVHAMPAAARGIATALAIAVAAAGLTVAVQGRRRLAAVAVGLTQAAYAVALLGHPGESAENGVFAALFALRAAAVVLLAAVLGRDAYAAWRTRAAVSRLATELGEAPAPGALQAALAASLGDPGVAVAYPIDGRFIDATGHLVEAPAATADRALTRIVRGSRCIAVVAHARGVLAEDQLAREIGASARLAVENERLRAELLFQLAGLRASRARIVDAADAARRTLERNLHDGAQQRLLALVYDLRLARSTAQAQAEDELGAALDGALDDAQAALEELRLLAHGIHPAILTEAGLGPALWGLVDQATIPVRMVDPGADRYPTAVERAVYVVADDAIVDACSRHATRADLAVHRAGTRLVIEVEDDGVSATSVRQALIDRVGAVGGRIERAGPRLRAELPCA